MTVQEQYDLMIFLELAAFLISGFIVIIDRTKKSMVLLVATALFLLYIMAAKGPRMKSECELNAIDSTYAGEVVDKEIINAYSNLFMSRDMDYRVIIEVPYEYNAEQFDTTKSISVDKETYLSVDIGDWFDSHTLEAVTSPD